MFQWLNMIKIIVHSAGACQISKRRLCNLQCVNKLPAVRKKLTEATFLKYTTLFRFTYELLLNQAPT